MLGALAFFYIEHELSGLTESWGLALGIMFILVVIFAPRGLMGLVQGLRRT
jgi:branched-chain amino acid transport system permease protein